MVLPHQSAHPGFRPGLTDALDGGQQQVAGRRRAGSGHRPELLQDLPESGLLGREPERAGESKVARSGGPRDRGSAVLDQSDELVGGAEIGLMDNAGLAVDAGAFDDVVVELVVFFLARSEAIG